VVQWGVEGLLTAIERGGARDWGRILNALDADATGTLQWDVAQAVQCADPDLGSTRLIADYLVDRLFADAGEAGELVRQRQQEVANLAERRRQVVRTLRDLGVSYGGIARRLGCTRSTIQSILR
jgi:DNA-directed RNA polymerase specialized sigma24 family protein